MDILDKNTLKALVEKGLLSKGDFNALIEGEETEGALKGAGLLAEWYDGFHNFLEANYSKQTVVGYTSSVRGFLAGIYGDGWADVKEFDFVTRGQVADWFDKLASEGYSFASIRRCKNSLMKFFEYLNEKEGISTPIIRNLEVPDIHDEDADSNFVAIRDEEMWGIIGHTETLRDRAMLSLMYDTGMRRQEVIDLLKADIDLDALTVNIRGVKETLDRIVYFSPKTGSLIKEYLDEWKQELADTNRRREERARRLNTVFDNKLLDSEYLFQTIFGKKVSYSTLFKNLKAAAYNYYLAVAKGKGLTETEAAEEAEEKSAVINTEVVRHSQRTYLFSQGKSVQQVQLIMGDTNRWMCNRFLKLAQILYPESFRT